MGEPQPNAPAPHCAGIEVAAHQSTRHKVLRTSKDLAYTTLGLVRESADAFPPLKSAVGGVHHVIGIHQRVRHIQFHSQDLNQRGEALLQRISNYFPDPSILSDPMLEDVMDIESNIQSAIERLDKIMMKSRLRRLANINRYEQELLSIDASFSTSERNIEVIHNEATRLSNKQVQTVVQMKLAQIQDIQVEVQDNITSLTRFLKGVSLIFFF